MSMIQKMLRTIGILFYPVSFHCKILHIRLHPTEPHAPTASSPGSLPPPPYPASLESSDPSFHPRLIPLFNF